jgi:hypothetical protein
MTTMENDDTQRMRLDQLTELPPAIGQTEHSSKFHFARAFWTTTGIWVSLLVASLVPLVLFFVIFSLFGGIGEIMDRGPEILPPAQSEPAYPSQSPSCDSEWEAC